MQVGYTVMNKEWWQLLHLLKPKNVSGKDCLCQVHALGTGLQILHAPFDNTEITP